MSPRAMTPEQVADLEKLRVSMDEVIGPAIEWTPKAKPRLVHVPIPETTPTIRIARNLPGLPQRPDVRVSDKTYIIVSAPFVKIGIAHDVEARFRALMATNPHPMECVKVLLGGRDVERALHKRFAAYRHRDEWFRLEGDLAEWINAGCPDD